MAVVVAWVRCDDDGGMMMMMVVGLVGCGCWREGGEKWRVAASGSGDRVHRLVGRSYFGLAGKIPPENFSGGGSGGRRWGDPPEKKVEREMYNILYHNIVCFALMLTALLSCSLLGASRRSPKPVLLSLKHAQLPVLGSTRMYRDLRLPTIGLN
ncbi:hypothetical protein Tco_1316611 [Tanacetum coccineum]